MIRLIGLVLFAVGIALLIFAYNASQSLGEQVTEAVSGRFTNQSMWYLFGGIAAVVSGGAMALWGGRRSTT